METLRIEHKTSTVIKKAISVIFMLNGVLWILGHVGSLKFYHWFFGITFIILGILYFKDFFGTEESYIEEDETFLKVRWINKFRPISVQNSDIKKITLTRFKVIVEATGKKPIILTLDFFEREQKKVVYDFFIAYAGKRNLELVKEF